MMLFKKLDKSEVKKILVITLSNIGDVVMTFPVIDILREDFPEAQLSVLVGPKAESLLRDNPNIQKTIVFDKHQSLKKTISMVWNLKKQRYHLVVDLRHTAIPFLIGPKFRTPLFKTEHNGKHMRLKHLARLKSVYDFDSEASGRYCLTSSEKDQTTIAHYQLGDSKKFVVISPGAADHKKRWSVDGFAKLADQLIENYDASVVLVGDDGEDRKVVQQIIKKMNNNAINLSGLTTLPQLALLIEQCILAIGNDSAPLHMASYLNKPVIALFGPTDPEKYGPWSRQSHFICKNKKNGEDSMSSITVDDILNAITFTTDKFETKL